MSKGINKWHGVGNLCKDPEMRYTADSKAIATITVACNDSYKDKATGQMVDKTEFVRVVAFGRLAEIIGEYLKKGSQVYIEGKIQTRKWQDQQGQDRYTTEIVANDLQMLGGGQGQGSHQQGAQQNNNAPQQQQAPQQQAPQQQGAPSNNFNDFDGDSIPF